MFVDPNFRARRPLRVVIFRRRGIIAALIRSIARAAERRSEARFRAQPVPDYLRADIGLPPAPPRWPDAGSLPPW